MMLAILCAMFAGFVAGVVVVVWWFPTWLRSKPERIAAFMTGMFASYTNAVGIEAFWVREAGGTLVAIEPQELVNAIEADLRGLAQ